MEDGKPTTVHTTISRPAPDPKAEPDEQVDDLLSITVFKPKTDDDTAYALLSKRITLQQLDQQLTRLSQAAGDKTSVIIKCTPDSKHGDLVALLDVCEKVGLKNMSVFSL